MVLDEIYATRLPVNVIQNIIWNLLYYSKDGVNFIKEIYKDCMVETIKNEVEKEEKENQNKK